MQPEILLFDIGNTSIKIGLGDERHVLSSYTLRTAVATCWRYGLAAQGLRGLFCGPRF